MFSSTNNISPSACFPSSSYPCLPTPLTSQDSGCTFLHRHHDLLPGALVPAVNPQITDYLINMPMLNNPTITKKMDVIDSLNGGRFDESGFLPQKKLVKKDRHSKICTANGVRHRRVRLSLEIAREFFDLQDMLGFDKASKTLDWLLKSSKNAIKELAKTKSISGTMSSTSECEVESEDDDLERERTVSKSKALVGVSKEKKMKRLQKAATVHPAKESREKARARARERTREKMCSQRIHDLKKFLETSPQILNKSNKSETSHNILPQEVEELGSHQAPREEGIFREAVVIKRKMKPSAILGYQQNSYFPDLPQNLDINGTTGHSTVSAVNDMNL